MPDALVTVTATAQTPCDALTAHVSSLAGTVTLSSLSLSTFRLVAATSPKSTAVAPVKPEPTMSTVLPPPVTPSSVLT